MITATRRIQFCAGHRVARHESKCRNLHGHNWVVEVTAEADALDSVGRVIDFGVLKARVGGWIDEHWDHGFILDSEDREAVDAVSAVPGQKMFLLLSRNPTAENLAGTLLHTIGPEVLADTGVRVVRVRVRETENCWAEASLP